MDQMKARLYLDLCRVLVEKATDRKMNDSKHLYGQAQSGGSFHES